MGKVKETIVNYGHTTSVKGLSKAVKSSRLSLRILWLFAFCIGSAAGVYQITSILIKYYSYDSYTSISLCNGCHPPFPDVTLCHLNPISLLEEFSDVLQLNQYLTYLENFRLINDTEQVFGTNDTEVLEEVFGWIYSLPGYFQNVITVDVLGILATSQFKKALVQDCTWYDWSDSEYKNEDCTEQSQHYYFTDEFFMCTTLHLNESNENSATDQVKAVQALLFLNDFSDRLMPFYSPHILRSVANGVRVYIHPPNSLPEMGKGFNIPPGHEVKVALKATKITREPSPYSDCMEDPDPLEINELHHSAKNLENWFINYNYSSEAATSICKQEKVIEVCGCFTHYLPYTFKMASKYPDITGCMNQGVADVLIDGVNKSTVDLPQLIKDVMCVSKDIDIDSFEADCVKQHPCQEYMYEHQISQSSWPHEAYELAFYCDAIRQPNCDTIDELEEGLGEAFQVYDEILYTMQVNATLGKQQLKALDLIPRNFINLKITFSNPQMVELTDHPTLTVAQLFGSLGGLFNLWIGITFFTLIELIDLCVVIGTQSCCCCAKKRKEVDAMKIENGQEPNQGKEPNNTQPFMQSPASQYIGNNNNEKTVVEDLDSLPKVE